jgi:hypothetical protein
LRFSQPRELTFQLPGQLSVLSLVVVVCLGGELQIEFPDSKLIQPINDFVVQMLNLFFEGWDLSGKSVDKIFKSSTA